MLTGGIMNGGDETDVIGARLLAADAHKVPLPTLAEHWFCQRIEARLPGLGLLAHHPSLLPRVRGALGARMKESASEEAIAGAPCPWRPPCALWVFFGRRPKVRIGRHGFELPAPWTLTADAAEDGALIVGMHIFGFATEWADAAMEALAGALLRRIRWGELLADAGGRRRAPRAILETMHMVTIALALPPAEKTPDSILVALPHGLDIGSVDILEHPDSLFSRLARRISGLARWHDCVPDADWGALAQAWRGLHYEFLDPGEEDGRWRRSSRQKRTYPDAFRRVLMRISGNLEPLMPLLAIGTLTGVGRHTTAGLGRLLWEAE